MIASLKPDFSINQKKAFLLYLDTNWKEYDYAFYESLKPDYLKGWIERWKTYTDKTNSESKSDINHRDLNFGMMFFELI
jgi:hypothetical protein